MASIQARRDKSGRLISYSIRVHRGRDSAGRQLKPYTATFEVSPTWTEPTARKKAEAFAATFEKQCKDGLASDSRQTFEQYGRYVIELKAERGLKSTTFTRYKEFLNRMNEKIGHIRIKDLRPDMLNDLYTWIGGEGMNKRTGGKLSSKTVLEHHRLIHCILKQAVMEGLIPVNPADRVIPPKAEKPEVRYFQPEEIQAIRDALEEEESIKWKALVHLLIITGARRGEILGLQWEDIDFEKNKIKIERNVQYTPERGIYVDTPKTRNGFRTISVPQETISLLRSLKAWQAGEKIRIGQYYNDQGFLFTQDDGGPMHPDSVNRWLERFAERHGLPRINPHGFRHTMASVLYYGGADSVSISRRLGHAQVSTTANIYAHLIEQADEENAEILGKVLNRKKA